MSTSEAVLAPVLDVEPTEVALLSPAMSDFALILLAWCMIAWALRLLYLGMTLREMMHAQRAGRLTCFDDVPLHDLVVPLDVDTRRRFLSYLRGRVLPAPTAAARSYASPVLLRTARLKSKRGGAVLDLSFECTLPSTLQIFWDVDTSALRTINRCERRGSSRTTNEPSPGTAQESVDQCSVAAASEPGSPPGTPGRISALSRSLRNVRTRISSARTQPVCRQLSAIELASLNTVGPGSNLQRAPSAGSAAVTPSAGAPGSAVVASPSHTLPADSFRRCSAPLLISAGALQTLSLSPEQAATATTADEELPCTSAVLLFSRFGSCPPAACATTAGADTLPSSLTSAPRTYASAVAIALAFEPADAAPASAPAGAPATATHAAGPAGAPAAEAVAPTAEDATAEYAKDEGASMGADDESPGAEGVAEAAVLRAERPSDFGGEDVDGATRDGGAAERRVMRGVVTQTLLATAEGLLQLSEVIL